MSSNTRETAERIAGEYIGDRGTPAYRHDELVDAIESALKDEREAKWLPIESAPKDSNRYVVLCELDDGWQVETSYQNEKGDWIYQDCEPFFCLGYYMEPKFFMAVSSSPPSAATIRKKGAKMGHSDTSKPVRHSAYCERCGFKFRPFDRVINGKHFPDCGGCAPEKVDPDYDELFGLRIDE